MYILCGGLREGLFSKIKSSDYLIQDHISINFDTIVQDVSLIVCCWTLFIHEIQTIIESDLHSFKDSINFYTI